MKHTKTITADGTYFLARAKRRNDAPSYIASLMAGGTWGGGTLTLKLSPDKGVTLYPYNDLTGVAISFTDNNSLNTELGVGDPGSNADWDNSLEIWAVLSGSTTPSLTVSVYDNL